MTVDSTTSISEVNENDNAAPTDFVIPAATVDLTITGLSIEPEEQRCGCDCNDCDNVKPAYSSSDDRAGRARHRPRDGEEPGQQPVARASSRAGTRARTASSCPATRR